MAPSLESLDVSETANKNKAPTVTQATFIQKFCGEFLEKQESGQRNTLIEEAMTKDSLAGTEIMKSLLAFRASEDGKYNHIEIEKIDIFMLRKHLAKGYTLYKKSLQTFQTFLLKEYELSADELSKKILPKLLTVSQKKIEILLRSESERAIFLKDILGKTPKNRMNFDPLAGISESQMQSRVKALKEPEKTEIGSILMKIQNGGVPKDIDIRTLLESSLFDEQQKIHFVQTFVPFLNLQRAIDIGLFDEPQAKKIRETFLKETLEKADISSDNKEALKKEITFGDIDISTAEFIKNASDAIKISQNVGFDHLEKDFQNDYTESLETIKRKGPQSFEDLKKLLVDLGKGNRFENITLLGEGKILRVTKKAGGDDEMSYLKITRFDDTEKKFYFQVIGNTTVSLSHPGEEQDVEYNVFLENVKNASQNILSVFTEGELKEKMQTGEVKTNTLQLRSEKDFEGEEKAGLRKELQDKKVESLDKKITELNGKILAETESGEKGKLLGELEKIKREKERIINGSFSPKDAKFEANKQEFLSKMDELDSAGSSLGLGKGVAFVVGEKDEINVYTIQDIDFTAWKIHYTSRAGSEENVDLNTFYDAFEKKKAKRKASMVSDSLFVKTLGEKFEYKNGDIIEKDADLNGKKENRKVEYLTNEKGKLIKIISLGNGKVEMQRGEISEGSDDHHRKKGDKKNHAHHGPKEKKYILKIQGAEVENWSLDELHHYIEENKFTASWKTGQSFKETPLAAQNPTHGSIVDKFFKGMSIYELIHGGKMVIEGIKETLEHGSHAKSAHAALTMAKWLPESLRDEMLMKVEAAEAEETEKAKKKLGSIDSWMAIDRIKAWLLNSDTPQYKLEAGALFMMEKYGHLTTKQGLYPYRGKFLWYERLGGRIGDELYNEVMNETKGDDQSFAEERLVHRLLKKQCDRRNHHYSGIHRRSRVHKEFENVWKSGIEAEFQKGEKDAGAFRGSTRMAKEGMGEATGGTSSNAFGWAKKAAAKGTAQNVRDYMLIPAAFLLSGACYDIDQATYTSVKGFWDGEGIPVIAFRMFGDTKKMDLFRSTVLELSREIQQAYPGKFGNMYEETLELHNDSKSRKGTEKERLERAAKYWEKYGDVLTRALNMSLESDVGKDSDYSKTDTVIRRKRKENATFDSYFKLVRGAVGEGNAFKDEFVDDWVGETGVFGLNPHDIILKHMILSQDGGFRNKSIGPKVWEKFVRDIDSTKQKHFAGPSLESSENRQAQKEYIAEMLEEITGTFYEMFSQRVEYTYGLNRPTSNIGLDLNRWGLNFEDTIGAVAPKDILDGKYRSKFEQVAENIISGNGDNSTISYNTPDIMKRVKTQTAANLNRSSFSDAS